MEESGCISTAVAEGGKTARPQRRIKKRQIRKRRGCHSLVRAELLIAQSPARVRCPGSCAPRQLAAGEPRTAPPSTPGRALEHRAWGPGGSEDLARRAARWQGHTARESGAGAPPILRRWRRQSL